MTIDGKYQYREVAIFHLRHHGIDVFKFDIAPRWEGTH